MAEPDLTWSRCANVIEALPEWLKTHRENYGLSLRDVAADTDISLNALSRYERGMHNMGQTSLVKLLRYMADHDDWSAANA